jgi:membrane protein DedA with SNARE-associated domain
MFITLQQIISWLIVYKYAVLFPVTIVEGPIVTVIAGFLVAHGLLSFLPVYAIIVAGDLTGDVLYYAIGRWGRNNSFIMRIAGFVGINDKRIEGLEQHFAEHSGKTLIIGKITHGVGSVVLFASGAAKMPIGRFVWFNLLGTLPKSLLFLLIGYYFGETYKSIGKYIDYTALATFTIAILLLTIYILVVRFFRKKSGE